jgi:hypothetical protein
VKLLLFKLMLFARSALARLRTNLAAVSKWLVMVGLAIIAYGVVYWMKGYPYAVVMMMVCAGYGSLVLGTGLALRRPETTPTLVLATISFAAALVLLLVTQPGTAFSFGLLAFVGVATSFIRLRQRRRARPPSGR